MFLLKSNDNLLLNSIIDVLNQKFTIFNTNEATNSFATLSISSNESTFCIETDNYKKNIFKPLSSTKLFEEIDSILTKININFNDLSYRPVKQNITYEKKSLVLGNIHNLIFSALLLHIKSGISKDSLYEMVWPQDKNYQINKLDTHLTNLKNLINQKLGYHFNFKTIEGKIFLISN